MHSINYFLSKHSFFIFILSGLITFIIIYIFSSFSFFLIKHFKIPENLKKTFMGAFVILGLFTGFIGIGKIIDLFNLGGIKKIFIIDKNNTPQLTVWFTRIHSKRVGADYDQRLRCYELESGRSLDYIQMLKRYYDDDYRIYWLSGQYAWGYSRKTGIQLLDLVKPELIATEKEILSRNPELGQEIKRFDLDNLLDPYNHGIRVETKDNKIYQIDIDLNAKEINKNSFREPVTDIGITLNNNKIIYQTKVDIGNIKQNNYSNQKSLIKDPNIFQNDWVYSYVKATLGKKLYKKGFQLSEKSVYLLEPEFIDELNLEPVIKNKVWISHKSAIYGEYDPLISFVDANGNELNKINLYEIFKNKKVKVLGTYTGDKDIIIFIGIGETHRASIEGFTLTGLKTDPGTGKIIDKIKYF